MFETVKCPKCKLVPNVARTSRWYGWWIFHIRIRGYIIFEDYSQCYKREFFSLTENGVYRKWNRFATRIIKQDQTHYKSVKEYRRRTRKQKESGIDQYY